MKKGDIIIYCGETNIIHTKNKKYFIKKIKKYFANNFFVCIADDIGTDNWYQIESLEKDTYFKFEKTLRNEKLKKLEKLCSK